MRHEPVIVGHRVDAVAHGDDGVEYDSFGHFGAARQAMVETLCATIVLHGALDINDGS